MLYKDIETDRLKLKCISEDDREFIFAQFSDADVCRYLFDEPPFSSIDESDALIGFYTQPEPRNQHRWILTLKSDGEKIGTCGYHCVNGDSAEIGYDLKPGFRKRGYMSEALEAILIFAKADMRLKRVDAHIYIDNEASIRVAERLGFAYLGETLTLDYEGREYLHRVYTRFL